MKTKTHGCLLASFTVAIFATVPAHASESSSDAQIRQIENEGSFEIFAKNDTELFAPPFGPITFQLAESEGKVTALKTSNGREFRRIE